MATQDNSSVADDDAASTRRKLLKAAVGTGVAAAVYSAPKISVVPAYGLTNTNGQFNGVCYGIVWSSNAPVTKGWVDIAEADGALGGPLLHPGGPTGSSDFGNGPVSYTWALPAFPGFPASTLTIRASGCVNAGTGQWTVSGLPSGYCVKLYNSGRPYNKDTTPSACGNASNPGTQLVVSPRAIVSPTVIGNGQTATISRLNATSTQCESQNSQGKIKWVFDVGPC
jgi:hypothetical protein